MNKQIARLYNIANKKERLIIGLMSGTSLDGLDIALCKCQGSGVETEIEILNFTTVAYDDDFKKEVKSVFSKKDVNLEKVCLLNAWIGTQHANMINKVLQDWEIINDSVDIIASHGQTIYHAPKILHTQEKFDNATLQIGDGDHIAVKTNIITISDFRQKHIAAGGEGAPLAVYGDYLIFSKQDENRIMLNIGGIANFTFLSGSLDASKMFSTDVGPGNTIMDAYVQQYFTGMSFDKDASIAKQGNINKALLLALKKSNFFEAGFPKTTGPELFNLTYLEQAKKASNTNNLSHFDIMATLNKFSADIIVDAINRTMQENKFIVYASGGGMHNSLLMEHIQNQLPNAVFGNIEDLKIHPDAKEALLFAILANECICGGTTNFGNDRDGVPNVSMGKISFPK